MAEPLADKVIRRIGQAAELYHRLVMLVAPAGAGKTAALQDVHERTAAPLVNVNLELSRRMLDLTERQRALQLPRLLSEIVGASAADVILAGQHRSALRCLAQAGPAAAAAGALAEQDGGRGLERLHRRRAHGLCDAGSSRIQTISLTRFPGSEPGGRCMKTRNESAGGQTR